MGVCNVAGCLETCSGLRDACKKSHPCLADISLLCIFKVTIMLILLVNVMAFILLLFNRQINQKTTIKVSHAKPLPTNNVTGVLHLYNIQWLEYSHALFVPEIYNHHIVFRLHLKQFIDTYRIESNNFENITFQCYEVSHNIPNRNIKPFLTTYMSISIVPEFTVSIFFYKNYIKYGHIIQIVGNLTDPLLVHLPLLVSDRFSYKFSFYTKKKSETVLKWPSWPLSFECVRQCEEKLSSMLCRTTDELHVLSPQQIFTIERKSLSVWLDAQYQVSDIHSVIPNRRLHPFERASNNTICTAKFQKWVTDYQVWHSNIGRQISRAGLTFAEQRDIIIKLNVRFILLESFGSGTADRITHLIATYLVALLTNRFFLFDDTWPEFHEIMLSSMHYRAEIVAPWIFYLNEVNANISLEDPRFFSVKSQILRHERPNRVFDYDKEFPQRILLIKSHTGNVIHTITASTSVYSEFLTRKLHMKADNLFGCLYHSLILPRLSTLIDVCSVMNDSTQYMLQILMFPRYPTIGIQIRVGDSSMVAADQYLSKGNQLLNKYMSFFQCAQSLRNGQVAPLVYLISDSRDLRLAAMTNWPHPENNSVQIQVITDTRAAIHISYTTDKLNALRLAMFETFLFSLCETHIITTDSGFGRFPAFASLYGVPIYSFNVHDRPKCSRGKGQITLIRAGHHWSGIR